MVTTAVRAKFSQNPNLREQLVSTFPRHIGEASSADKIWGIGLNASDVDAEDEYNWTGQSLLGEILEEIRNELRAQNESFPEVLEQEERYDPPKQERKTPGPLWRHFAPRHRN